VPEAFSGRILANTLPISLGSVAYLAISDARWLFIDIVNNCNLADHPGAQLVEKVTCAKRKKKKKKKTQFFH
jgi:hypothetical protein